MRVREMIQIPRIGALALHPGGNKVAFEKAFHNPEKNEIKQSIVLLDIETKIERVISSSGDYNGEPAWSPCGRYLAFVSDRLGEKQLFVLPYEEGGDAYPLSTGAGGASKPVWAPDSKRIAFSRSFVVSKQSSNTDSDQSRAERYGLVNKASSARLEDRLLYRHWKSWRELERSHLCVIDRESKELVDITPGDADVPPISLGGRQDYCFSPDGTEIVYVKNSDDEVAISTNNSLYLQKLSGCKTDGDPLRISCGEAMDLEPRYSSDSQWIYYLGAEVPAYEADRLRVYAYRRSSGETSCLSEGFDRSPHSLEVDSKGRLWLLADDLGYCSIYSLDPESTVIRQHSSQRYFSNLKPIPDGKLLALSENFRQPAEICCIDPGVGSEPDLRLSGMQDRIEPGSVDLITSCAGNAAKQLSLEQKEEEFWFPGADGDPVHGFLLKPASFDENKVYPLVLLIHGGPQSAFSNHFHYRWNPLPFVEEGFIVAMINPRGSTGYGQRFCDQISGDWGGRAYTDLMAGLDFLLETRSYLDADKIAAAGGSFGGFMVNWIAGHSDRFRALVSHDGIFHQETMSYLTEELWFDRHEHGGMPYENPKSYDTYSPHRFVENFQTPMLVVQGEQDFRCPVSEGLALFTALQLRNIPSKLLYFPDEGHWVEQPANSEVWYRSVLDFIKEFLI